MGPEWNTGKKYRHDKKGALTIMRSAFAVATVVGTWLLLRPTAQATPICNSRGDYVNFGSGGFTATGSSGTVTCTCSSTGTYACILKVK